MAKDNNTRADRVTEVHWIDDPDNQDEIREVSRDCELNRKQILLALKVKNNIHEFEGTKEDAVRLFRAYHEVMITDIVVSRSGRLGLSPLEAKEALGLNPDQGLHSYEGSRADAAQDLLDFSLKRTRNEIAELLSGVHAPEHKEAKVIVWSNLHLEDGFQVNVTAREGATPEMVAGTVLVYKTALEILKQKGVG